MILYFSGTGNTKYIAKYLADHLHDECVDMSEYTKEKKHLVVSSDKPFVIASPIYAWRLPLFIEDLLKDAKLEGNDHVYGVVTRESESGNAEKYLKDIIEKDGKQFMGMFCVNMPNQYLLAGEVASKEETSELDAIVNVIKSGVTVNESHHSVSGAVKSGVVNTAFNKFMVSSKRFKVSDDCIGCGKCARGCPVGNITMKDGHPVFGDHCTWCFYCMQHCPKSAIDYGNSTKGKPRNVCPEYK